MKLYDSELHVMELLWQEGPTTAKRLAELAKTSVGWSKTTTYTVIKKCLEKAAIAREEPHFVCRPLVSREQVQAYETTALINKLYQGAPDRLVASLLEAGHMGKEDLQRLKQWIEAQT